MKACYSALALVPLTCAAPAAAALKMPLLWTAELNTVIENAATVADINGDGRAEAVIAGYTQLIAVDGSGKVLWQWENKDRFGSYPAVWLRPSGRHPGPDKVGAQGLERPDRPALIYVADNGGHLNCLDGAGKEVWRAALKGLSAWSAAVVCDLKGDGTRQVIQTDSTGAVWAFDALTGSVVWQGSVEGAPVSPAVADLDGDGRPEIVVATGSGVIAALRSDGSPLWRRALGSASPSWQTSAPVVFTAADGSRRVAVGFPGGEFYCLDALGETLWTRQLEGPVPASISVADYDGDGLADIFCVTERGAIYRFREDGRMLWSLDMKGRTLAPGAIADVNADGKLEFALCTQNGRLMVLGRNAELLFDRRFEHRTINGTPAFGNLRPETPGLEMVIPGGESGKVLCFGTAARPEAALPWPMYRHDPAMSGTAGGPEQREAALQEPRRGPSGSPQRAATMVPGNLAWDEVLCGQGVRFEITNPTPGGKPLAASASCLRPDGAQQAVTIGLTEHRGELVLPVEALSPGTYAFTWCLADAEGRTLSAGSEDVFLQPFANDRALARRAAEALRSAADFAQATLALSASALRREARRLEDDARALAPAQEAALAAGADEAMRAKALEQTAELTASAGRALRMSDLVRQAVALGAGTSVIAFEPANLWESRAVSDELPAQAAAPLAIHRRAVPGEHEPVAVNVLNITDRTVHVRVVIERGPDGPGVTALRAMGVPTPMGEIAYDPLPDLDESAAVAVPSLSGAQLWFDLDLAGVKPGEHEVTVRLQALEGAGVLEGPKNRRAVAAPETVVKIALEVLPFEMAPEGSFRLCTWGNVEGSRFKDFPEATYENLLAHGNNVWPVGGLPAAEYDAQGALTKALDFGALEARVGRFRGRDVVLLLQGMPSLNPAAGAGEYGSPAYRRALKAYLADLVAHMSGLGFSREHYALYEIDEPGGCGWPTVRRLVEFRKMVREADPKVLLYTDGGGDVPMFEELAPVTDIWCPGLGQYAQEPEKTAILRAPGKSLRPDLVGAGMAARRAQPHLWSYDCGYANATAAGRTLKAGDVIAAYRTSAISAFRYGLSGAGFWTSITGAEDLWQRTDSYDYMMLYPGRTKPVTSRRWEAVREGIEDFRILTALRARLEATGQAALDQATRARITHLLEVSVPRLDHDAMNAQEIPQHLDETMTAVRGEMMDCVAAALRGHPEAAPQGRRRAAAARQG